jgi:hypothetical protein
LADYFKVTVFLDYNPSAETLLIIPGSRSSESALRLIYVRISAASHIFGSAISVSRNTCTVIILDSNGARLGNFGEIGVSVDRAGPCNQRGTDSTSKEKFPPYGWVTGASFSNSQRLTIFAKEI